MSVVAKVLLMPVPSSRAAAQAPDGETEQVFEALPGKGDVLTLDDTWPEQFRGRGYMVNGAEWPLRRGHATSTSKPTIEAIRCS